MADSQAFTVLRQKPTLEGTNFSGKGKQASLKAFAEKIFRGNFSNKPEKPVTVLEEFTWEYVVAFYNPDFKAKKPEENSTVTEELAESSFRECFKPKKTGSIQSDHADYISELYAFMDVFRELEDFGTGKQRRYGNKLHIEDGQIFEIGGLAKDFSTLMRNALFYKLVSGLGLKAKQVVSETGEFIYILITADESDLEIEAERTRYSKELEIALTDIQSLLPCDKSLRPMQLVKTQDADIKSIYKEIKQFMNRALNTVSSDVKGDYRFEPNEVTEVQWRTYKIYLALLKEGISKIESSFEDHRTQMFLLQKLIRESLEKANQGLEPKDRLMNLWNRLGINKPVSAFAEFRRSTSNDVLYKAWKTHEISESGKRSMFSRMERLRLLSSYIDTQISLSALKKNNFVAGYFPLHNYKQLKGKNTENAIKAGTEDILLRNMLVDFKNSSSPKDQSLAESWTTSLINQKIPLNKIRKYFGEKIALYFEFLRFYQQSLLIPSIFGLILFILQRIYDADTTSVQVLNALYSIFMTIWATIYLEMWKRKEAALSVIWGQINFERVEIPRPQYKGTLRRSPITDEMDEIYYDPSKRFKYFLLAVSVTLFILCMILGIVAGLLVFKYYYSGKYKISNVDITLPVCSILNAIQIQVFNYIYSKLVVKLTDLENHKTQIQYEDSLVLKTFIFQFVNSFNSLCYIAFIKTYVEGCIVTDSNGDQTAIKEASCMNELYTQLIAIFIVSYLKNLVELGLPFIKYQLRSRKKKNNVVHAHTEQKDIRTKLYKQLCLETYLSLDHDGTIDDYLELSVQFGYLTLFALAFPLSTTLAFVGLWLEMYTDKLKIMKLVRRPLPLAIKDIGTWWYIFSSICVLAIFSNTALFCFTSRTFKGWVKSPDYEYLIFAVIVVILLIFRSQLQSWIPDIEEKYEIVMARHEYVIDKVLRGADNSTIEEDVEIYDGTIYFAQKVRKDNDQGAIVYSEV